MSCEILTFGTNDLSNPLLDSRVIDVVVVNPLFLARVVRRIDVDAVDLALILGEERLQSFEIVSVDDHVSAVGTIAVENALVGDALEYAIGHLVIVVDDLVFSHPIKRRHNSP